MKQTKIATTCLLLALLGIGIASCNRSQPAQENKQTTSTPDNTSVTSDRAQRRLIMQTKIKAVLTPAQVQQLEAKRQAGSRMREALKSIDLSADQAAKIAAIYQANRDRRRQLAQESKS